MTIESNALQEAQKQEAAHIGDAEPTRDRHVFVPRVDIYEDGEQVVIVADMPGVNEKSVDIMLEKNVLTINGRVEFVEPANLSLTWSEYSVGDYKRSFTLSDGVDRDHIEATVIDGVLRLYLPKAAPAKTKKIAVKVA